MECLLHFLPKLLAFRQDPLLEGWRATHIEAFQEVPSIKLDGLVQQSHVAVGQISWRQGSCSQALQLHSKTLVSNQ